MHAASFWRLSLRYTRVNASPWRCAVSFAFASWFGSSNRTGRQKIASSSQEKTSGPVERLRLARPVCWHMPAGQQGKNAGLPLSMILQARRPHRRKVCQCLLLFRLWEKHETTCSNTFLAVVSASSFLRSERMFNVFHGRGGDGA